MLYHEVSEVCDFTFDENFQLSMSWMKFLFREELASDDELDETLMHFFIEKSLCLIDEICVLIAERANFLCSCFLRQKSYNLIMTWLKLIVLISSGRKVITCT